MKTFFLKLWTDDTFFWDALLKLGKYGLGVVGVLIDYNIIPTGVDGGSKYGLIGLLIAAALPSRTQGAVRSIANDPPK